MTSRARVDGKTAEQQIWYWLRRQSTPQRCPEIAKALGMKSSAVTEALRRLQRKGSVTSAGRTSATTYTATKLKPEDFRGTSAGTIKALSARWKSTHRPHKRAFVHYGRPGIALEVVWPVPRRQA